MINKRHLDRIEKNQQAVTLLFDVGRQWMVNRKSTYEDHISSKFLLLSECDWHVSAH
jgi:hypothetical protein